MSTIAALWQTIETQYNNGTFPVDQLQKIDELVYSNDIENIRKGLTLMTTLAPEYLCRYLKLDGDSVVLRDAQKFAALLTAERVLVESVKNASMWQDLFESGVFESMEFRALGNVEVDDLSDSEKAFCIRMSKEMVRIPAGQFMMGALENDGNAIGDEKPRHRVTLTRDFLMGKYQVTQALWESVTGSNPSRFKGPKRPVERVSWLEVVEFCNKLSTLEELESVYTINGEDVTCNWDAKGYRLPTEAEWEYTARSGKYCMYSGSENLNEVACYGEDWDSGSTSPVGHKKPNGFGLYDMSGNVDEWVWDKFGGYSNGNQTDPTGPDSSSYRVTRGGHCFSHEHETRVSRRDIAVDTAQFYHLGFRLARFCS